MKNLNEKEIKFVQGAKSFAEEHIQPIAEELDQGVLPTKALLEAMGKEGYFGAHFSGEYGGKDYSLLASQMAGVEIAKASAGLTLMILVQWMAAETILKFGSEEQKGKWLPDIVSGRKIAAFTISEFEAGSDAAAMKAIATKVDGGYELNGEKYFSSNGSIADVFILGLKTDEASGARGISLFIVPAESKGLDSTENIGKMGCRSATMTRVKMENCFVTEEALIGEENKGFPYAMYGLTFGRLGMCSMGLGIAEAAFEYSAKYANKRIAFGKPLSNLYSIQEMVAEMHVKIEALRSFLTDVCIRMGQGEDGALMTSTCKLFAAQVVNEVCYHALQVLGGHGYCTTHPVERFARDGRLMDIGVGASEVLKMVVGGSVLRSFNK